MTKNTMTKNVAGNVDEQSWTDAFEKRSTEGFEAALAPDVVLNASCLVKPIVGRDLVKICVWERRAPCTSTSSSLRRPKATDGHG